MPRALLRWCKPTPDQLLIIWHMLCKIASLIPCMDDFTHWQWWCSNMFRSYVIVPEGTFSKWLKGIQPWIDRPRPIRLWFFLGWFCPCFVWVKRRVLLANPHFLLANPHLWWISSHGFCSTRGIWICVQWIMNHDIMIDPHLSLFVVPTLHLHEIPSTKLAQLMHNYRNHGPFHCGLFTY